MIRKSYLYLIFLIILFISGNAFPQEEKSKSLSENPTKLVQYVTDETGTLTSSEISALSKKLQEFDKKTSTQIVVYMISSLDGESLEDVSHTIAEKNKIGRKGKDNGALLFISKNDRKLRIEVGYGLEGALTDALCSQIIRNDITPSFRNNNFYEGIDKGTDAIIAVTKGEYTADKESSDGINAITCFGIPIFVLIVFGIIFFSIFMSILRRIFGFGRKIYSGGRSNKWSNWGGGGFFGGGGSSFGGGGGFSGGGGSFGGGGASGSW